MLINKYVGIVAFFLFFLSLAVSLTLYEKNIKNILPEQSKSSNDKSLNISDIDEQNIQRLYPKIATLIKPADIINTFDVTRLGYKSSLDSGLIQINANSIPSLPEVEEINSSINTSIPVAPELKKITVIFDYKISMIYYGKQKAAIVNGVLVKVGSQLPDGGEIKYISNNNIEIEKSGERRIISMNK